MALNLFNEFLKAREDEFNYYYPRRMFNVDDHIQQSIQKLIDNYSVQGLMQPDSLNFNRIELRCAYMYLYSTSHSHMVLDLLTRYQLVGRPELMALIHAVAVDHGIFNITSLGGGPGTDILGILVFLQRFEILDHCPPLAVTVIDEYEEWERPYRNITAKYSSKLCDIHFESQDLLNPFSPEVELLIKETSFLSMVKFISAIDGDQRSDSALKRIFSLLRSGSLVLIIDNAGGSAFPNALRLALSAGMAPVFGPFLHFPFRIAKHLEPHIKTFKYGKYPQTCSTISMAILKKSTIVTPSNIFMSSNQASCQQTSRSSTPRLLERIGALLNLRTEGYYL